MNLWKKPEAEYNVLSLGAGVQSSCVALMSAYGDLPPLDFAVFADVGAEPKQVADYLETLREFVNASPHPFPIYTVKHGNLEKDQLSHKTREKDSKAGHKKGSRMVSKQIPIFGLLPNGEITFAIGRKCTADYKIKPIIKFFRDKFKIKRGEKQIQIIQWIGISWDEMQRAKEPREKWIENYFPLLEQQMNRAQCFEWMDSHGFPEPPRSSCYFCPFHSNDEWRRLRDDLPEYFEKAVQFERDLQQNFKENDSTMRMNVYLHRSCLPLDQIDLDSDTDRGQCEFDFNAECEGMCGI